MENYTRKKLSYFMPPFALSGCLPTNAYEVHTYVAWPFCLRVITEVMKLQLQEKYCRDMHHTHNKLYNTSLRGSYKT